MTDRPTDATHPPTRPDTRAFCSASVTDPDGVRRLCARLANHAEDHASGNYGSTLATCDAFRGSDAAGDGVRCPLPTGHLGGHDFRPPVTCPSHITGLRGSRRRCLLPYAHLGTHRYFANEDSEPATPTAPAADASADHRSVAIGDVYTNGDGVVIGSTWTGGSGVAVGTGYLPVAPAPAPAPNPTAHPDLDELRALRAAAQLFTGRPDADVPTWDGVETDLAFGARFRRYYQRRDANVAFANAVYERLPGILSELAARRELPAPEQPEQPEQPPPEFGGDALQRTLQRTLFEECETAGWDPERRNSFGDETAHLHEEVSEAFRAYRKTHGFETWYDEDGKPQGVPVEHADVLIGLFYNAELHGYDLLDAVRTKHEWNLRRSYEAEGRRIHQPVALGDHVAPPDASSDASVDYSPWEWPI